MQKKKSSAMRRSRAIKGYLFISPWLIGLLLFFITPFFKTIQFSFGNLNFNESGYVYEFLGFDNFYSALRENVDYLPNLTDSLLEMLYTVPVVLIFSFFVSLLLKEKNLGTHIAKVIFFFPVIMGSGVFLAFQMSDSSVNSIINASIEEAGSAVNMLSSDMLTELLIDVGIPEEFITYITTPIDNIYSVVMKSGVQIFIFLAGLNSISPSLYEACYIEGGGAWETFWKITLPMMMPTLLINIIFSLIDFFTAESNVVMAQIYRTAFTDFKFGLSSAMCLIYVAILGVIMGVVGFFVSRKTFYYT